MRRNRDIVSPENSDGIAPFSRPASGAAKWRTGVSKRRLALSFLSLALTGCAASNRLTPDQKKQATADWNGARAGALANLAADQLKDGSFDKCQQTLDQALRLTPDSLPLHLLAARLSIEQGQMELAEAHLAKARGIDPKSAEPDFLTGVLLEHWHQPAKAADAYAAAASKDPNELSYLLAEADMLVATGKTDAALRLLVAKADAFPHSGVLRDEIGQILTQQRQPDQAVPYFRLAATLSPDDASVREHLAFALAATRHYAEAADAFERLTADLASPGVRRADLHAALGDCLSRTDRRTEARRAYETATTLAPDHGGYWLGLARTAADLADYPAADAAARHAVALDPGSNPAHCLLGYVRLKQDKLPAALDAFRCAAALDPADTLSLCMEGHLLDRLGRRVEARACYVKAKQINPADPLAARLVAAG